MNNKNNKYATLFSFLLLIGIIVAFVILINYETTTTPLPSSTNKSNTNKTTTVSSSTGSTSSNSNNNTLTVDQIIADITSSVLSNYPTTSFVNNQLATKLNNTGPVTLKGNLTVTGNILASNWPVASGISSNQLATKLNNTGPATFTGDLTIAGGSLFTTQLNNTGSANFIGNFTVDGNIYPTTLGSNGQVLTTDGAGHLTWAAVPVTTINYQNTIVQFNGTQNPNGIFTLESNRFVIDASLQLQNMNVGIASFINSSYNIDFNALNVALLRFTGSSPVENVITVTVGNCSEANVGVQVTVINAASSNNTILYLSRSTCNNDNSYTLQPSDSLVLTCYHSDVTRTNAVNCLSTRGGSNLNYLSNFVSVALNSHGNTVVLTNITNNNSYQGIIQVTIPTLVSRGLIHPFLFTSNYITSYTAGCVFTFLSASTYVDIINIYSQVVNYNTNSISFSIDIVGDGDGDNIEAGSSFTMAFQLI
jgi:hypothetical protein